MKRRAAAESPSCAERRPAGQGCTIRGWLAARCSEPAAQGTAVVGSRKMAESRQAAADRWDEAGVADPWAANGRRRPLPDTAS